ncbi:hypothetical protein Hanom_Chr03g00269241 [Helianthus anomalus]
MVLSLPNQEFDLTEDCRIPLPLFKRATRLLCSFIHGLLCNTTVAYVRKCSSMFHTILSQGSTVRLKCSNLHQLTTSIL